MVIIECNTGKRIYIAEWNETTDSKITVLEPWKKTFKNIQAATNYIFKSSKIKRRNPSTVWVRRPQTIQPQQSNCVLQNKNNTTMQVERYDEKQALKYLFGSNDNDNDEKIQSSMPPPPSPSPPPQQSQLIYSEHHQGIKNKAYNMFAEKMITANPQLTQKQLLQRWNSLTISEKTKFIDKVYENIRVIKQHLHEQSQEEYVVQPPQHNKERWTEEWLRRYFKRSYRFSRPDAVDPKLLDITHFKRYGDGKMFEFYCIFEDDKKKHITHPVWIEYTDLLGNQTYIDFLRNKLRWCINIEQEKYMDENRFENSHGETSSSFYDKMKRSNSKYYIHKMCASID